MGRRGLYRNFVFVQKFEHKTLSLSLFSRQRVVCLLNNRLCADTALNFLEVLIVHARTLLGMAFDIVFLNLPT